MRPAPALAAAGVSRCVRPRSLSDFYTNRRIRSPIDQFRLSYAKFSDLDATEKPKLRVAEQIKPKSDRLLGETLDAIQ